MFSKYGMVKKETFDEDAAAVKLERPHSPVAPPSPQKSTTSRFFPTTKELDVDTFLDEFKHEPAVCGRPRTSRSAGKIPVQTVPPPTIGIRTPTYAPILDLKKDQQFAAYLGNVAPLMLHARERYGQPGSGGMTTRQVRAWLNAHPEFIPAHLAGIEWHVDHIIGDNVGGHNWPANYFLMPKNVNLYFGAWLTLEKRRYVGIPAWSAATGFTVWATQKARATLPFGAYDPIEDKFLSKRSR